MDNLGDILGTIFGEGFGEGVFGEGRAENREQQPVIAYERYLCGGPKYLNINDR